MVRTDLNFHSRFSTQVVSYSRLSTSRALAHFDQSISTLPSLSQVLCNEQYLRDSHKFGLSSGIESVENYSKVIASITSTSPLFLPVFQYGMLLTTRNNSASVSGETGNESVAPETSPVLAFT